MDEINRYILEILKENSRESISSISKKVNLSRPSVKERILRMEESGIIEKYTIEIAGEPESEQIVFFTLMSNVKVLGKSFFKYIEDIPQVKSVDAVTGKANYLVKAEVSTTAEMQLVLKKLMKISSVETYISLHHREFDHI